MIVLHSDGGTFGVWHGVGLAKVLDDHESVCIMLLQYLVATIEPFPLRPAFMLRPLMPSSAVLGRSRTKNRRKPTSSLRVRRACVSFVFSCMIMNVTPSFMPLSILVESPD